MSEASTLEGTIRGEYPALGGCLSPKHASLLATPLSDRTRADDGAGTDVRGSDTRPVYTVRRLASDRLFLAWQAIRRQDDEHFTDLLSSVAAVVTPCRSG